MSIYNLIEYNDNYSKTSGNLWESYRDKPVLNKKEFPVAHNNSTLFKFKRKIAGRTGMDGTRIVKIMAPLKYLSNFWRILEMLLIKCEINLILTWSENCFVIDNAVDNQIPKFK